jgi:hypothetical protein
LHQPFKLLIWFHTLLLQDGALLYSKYPHLPLWQYPPFNSREFREFAATSVDVIAEVEARGLLAVKNLPQTLVRGFQGAISSLSMAQQLSRDEARGYVLGLDAKILVLTQQFQDGGGSNKRAGKSRMQQREPGAFSLCLLI